MILIEELLDRYTILYPDNEDLKDFRRCVVDQDFSSIFRLCGEEHEELRKAVMEKNIHSIFRILGDDWDELRKAVVEQNLWSIFRLVEEGIMLNSAGINTSDWTEEKLHLRKAICNENIFSLFKVIKNEDLRKSTTHKDTFAIFRMLEKLADTNFTQSFKSLMVNKIAYESDCFSRGQLHSKLWLVRELGKIQKPLGTVFLCAGWYATLSTMLFESKLDIDKVRSFDIDESTVDIAQKFNSKWYEDNWKFKALVADIMTIDYNLYHWQHWSNKNNRMSKTIVDKPDTIINTSCEHIADFDKWFDKLPDDKMLVLQSNNFYEVDEHVNCSSSLQEFSDSAPMYQTYYEGELKLPKYTRYMKIGYK